MIYFEYFVVPNTTHTWVHPVLSRVRAGPDLDEERP